MLWSKCNRFETAEVGKVGLCSQKNILYRAKVIKVDEAKKKAKVHYLGWHVRYVTIHFFASFPPSNNQHSLFVAMVVWMSHLRGPSLIVSTF
jgi:hypothetical protein